MERPTSIMAEQVWNGYVFGVMLVMEKCRMCAQNVW
jgi:hypothetical protein